MPSSKAYGLIFGIAAAALAYVYSVTPHRPSVEKQSLLAQIRSSCISRAELNVRNACGGEAELSCPTTSLADAARTCTCEGERLASFDIEDLRIFAELRTLEDRPTLSDADARRMTVLRNELNHPGRTQLERRILLDGTLSSSRSLCRASN